jgi:hypothetical protein
MIGNANKTIINAISNASPIVEKIAPDFSICFNSNIYNFVPVQFVSCYKDEISLVSSVAKRYRLLCDTLAKRSL